MAVPGGGVPTGPGYTPGPRLRFDVIGEAWRLLQQQMGTWIGAAALGILVPIAIFYVLYFVVFIGAVGMASRTGGGSAAFMFLPMLFGLVLAAVLGVTFGGLYKMALKQLRGEPIAVGDVFSATDLAGPLILAGILVGICTEIGFAICVIPGFIVGGLLMFTIPLVVDKRMAPIDAMRTSMQTLSPELVMAAVVYFVIALVAGIGSVACGIGMIVTFPLFPLSVAMLYRDYFDTGAAAGPGTGYVPPTPPVDTTPPAPPTV